MILLKLSLVTVSLFAFAGPAEGRSRLFDPLFSFPDTRRGRATPPATTPAASALPLVQEPEQEIIVFEEPEKTHNTMDGLLDKDVIAAIQSLSKAEMSSDMEGIAPALQFLQAVPNDMQELETGNGNEKLFRKVEDNMNRFGANMDRTSLEKADNFPQLSRQSGDDEVFLNGLTRQDVQGSIDKGDGVRCVPKVMQIEEIVYDRAIKCHHSYQEKCHLTYITDYQSTSEEKCETTFKKNCHITFKPMPFNETVSICNTPVERQCGGDSVGPDICSTQYETNCETRYNTYEVEQDEPVCVMEMMKKCKNVTVTLPRAKRQAESATLTPEIVTEAPEGTGNEPDTTDAPTDDNEGETLTFDQKCEEWPVQKCTLEKRNVKKVHPETSCKNIPREICVPNNCQTVPGKEICYDEVRLQVQNVPQEECDLQPEETCHMESVLVPKLVPQPNCVKVPKEICVNTKTNPRKVKKPIVKEWCYRPAEVIANGGQEALAELNE